MAPLLDLGAAEERLLGVRIVRGLLNADRQQSLLAEIRLVLKTAPLVRYATPWGRKMSVAMSNAGQWGWISGTNGYGYDRCHPETGQPWPAIPEGALQVWRQVVAEAPAPQCCLINHYGEGARMGLHQDADEIDFSAPVVSISLGDPARFRVGGLSRKGKTQSTILESGDVAVLEGDSRKAYHGIDGIRFGESSLLEEGGRFNLTLRVVNG